jgi:hypothetical protein
MLSVLPVKLDTFTFTPLIVEPVSVDATDMVFVVTVLPPRVDTYALRTPNVEPVIVDTVTVLPRSVE